MISILQLLGVSSPFDPSLALVSPQPWMSAYVLAAIRLFIASYALFVSIFDIAWQGVREHLAQSYFSYFTHLSYIGIIAYFFASGIQTLIYARYGQTFSGYNDKSAPSPSKNPYAPSPGYAYPLQRWSKILQCLHITLMSTIVTFPILVTIVYWGLLATGFDSRVAAWTGSSVHALNTVFAAFEILFTRIPPSPWLHLPICIVILGGYLGIAYITHETQGFYSYSFLDPVEQGKLLAAYIVGIAVAECIIFAIVHLIILLREFIIRKTRRESNSDNVRQNQDIDEEWVVVD